MDIHSHMAYYVAKKLGIDPNVVLDEWGVPQLIVTYGNYSNEESYRNFHDWRSMPPSSRTSQKPPKEYQVKFYGMEYFTDEEEEGED